MGITQFDIEGLGAERALDKLAKSGVAVISAQKPQKNLLRVCVSSKDGKKVFAILQGSCYNIKKIRPRALSRVARALKKSAGLLAGAVLFLSIVCFAQSRVLTIRVEGGGAYYETEVRELLRENGTRFFSAAPKKTAALSEKIMALPFVSFCSFSHAGGILTVDVEVNYDESALKTQPLRAPAAGIVERLTVVRGTPLVAVGDRVEKDQSLVGDYAATQNGTRPVLVIAEAVIAYPVAARYELDEEKALLQATLDYGELADVKITVRDGETLVEGTAHAGAALGLR